MRNELLNMLHKAPQAACPFKPCWMILNVSWGGEVASVNCWCWCSLWAKLELEGMQHLSRKARAWASRSLSRQSGTRRGVVEDRLKNSLACSTWDSRASSWVRSCRLMYFATDLLHAVPLRPATLVEAGISRCSCWGFLVRDPLLWSVIVRVVGSDGSASVQQTTG